MSDDTAPLSPRHECLVEEHLKDVNASQAYIRAGCALRGVQSCSSRMLVQPHIEAAIAVSRQRMAQECAKVAFANVDDFVEVDAEGRLHRPGQSRVQRAGVVEPSVTDHGKQWQRVKLKVGKLSQSTAVGAGNPGERGDGLTCCFYKFLFALAKPGDHSKPCQSDHRSGGNGQARGSTG